MSKKAHGKKPQPLSRSAVYKAQKKKGYPRVVAEGDSWFDYPLPVVTDPYNRKDMIDFIQVSHDYAILNLAQMGDTLENMAYNTLDKALKAIKREKPAGFLFSGGGNDVAGPELAAFLNHAKSGQPLKREKEFLHHLDEFVRPTYEHVLDRVTDASHGIQIFGHGYDYANPNGKPAAKVLWANLVGPWLDPVFNGKGVPRSQMQLRRETIRWFVDRFNEMLAAIAAKRDNFHYIKLTGTIGDSGWNDEIHPKYSSFKRLAAKMAAVMDEVLK